MKFYNRIVEKIKAISLKNVFGVFVTFLCITFVSMTMIGFVVPKEITLVDGESRRTVTTTRLYVEELLAEQKVTLRSGDRISSSLQSFLRDGSTITVLRGKEIVLTVGGKTKKIYSCASTLAEALHENAVTVGELDEVTPSLKTPVAEGMKVTVSRVSVYEEVKNEILPKKVTIKPTESLPAGKTNVITPGADGAATCVYRVTVRDGQEVSRQVVSQTTTVAPREEVVEIGFVGGKVEAALSDISYTEYIDVTATAYTDLPCCNGIYTGRTATGRRPNYGVIAVDPKVIPLGTLMYVEAVDGSWTYGFAIAGDTGGAIKGKKVDLFYNTHSECTQFGRRQARIYILN